MYTCRIIIAFKKIIAIFVDVDFYQLNNFDMKERVIVANSIRTTRYYQSITPKKGSTEFGNLFFHLIF